MIIKHTTSTIFARRLVTVVILLSAIRPVLAQEEELEKPEDFLFLHLSPSLYYRTDPAYPAGETTVFPDFRGFYELGYALDSSNHKM